MMNPAKLFKLKSSWEKFAQNHPKFPQFISAMQSNGIEEGTIIEINVTTAEGKNLSTNLKVTASDKEMFEELSELMK
jgi:alkyl sulfatase BDS1-like metallo-beta-lactamase superfamily hydrolase